ncbi:MAG: heparinase II/III family protein [Clostridia bacterium]|nr:heparinase II/III family protein [Clostridia bacterium]
MKKMFENLDIRSKLLPAKDFRPFIDIDPEALLKAMPADARARYHELGQRWLGYKHPELTGEDYREYIVNANRCNFEDNYLNRRTALIEMLMAGMLEGYDEYLPTIIDTMWLVLDEPTWVVPAHNAGAWGKPEGEFSYVAAAYDGNHTVELYTAETAAVLAWIYYYLKDEFAAKAPDMNKIICKSLYDRIIKPFMEHDHYGWMGIGGHYVNNWNPWIHSNVMLIAAIIGLEDELYGDVVQRCLTLTDNYVKWLPEDGGCNEGARYWNLSIACLMDTVEQIYDMTGGKVDMTGHDVLAKAAQYILAVYDRYGHAANFADSSITFWLDASLLVRMGRKTGVPEYTSVGAWLFRVDKLRTIHDNFYRQIKNMLEIPLLPKPEEPMFPEVVYMPGLQIFTVHKDDCMFAMKGGNNHESHNHNDLGSFVFYKGENPVLVDPGVDKYSGHTFNYNRYLNWYMQSAYHNTPNINGVQQVADGAELRGRPEDMPAPTRAYFATDPKPNAEACSYSLQLKEAYPDEALIESWVRTGSLQNGVLTITDDWNIDGDGNVVFHYMLCSKPTLTAPGELTLENGAVLKFDPAVTPEIEVVDLNQTFDVTRKPIWESRLTPRLFEEQWNSDHLFRVNLPVKGNKRAFTLTVE